MKTNLAQLPREITIKLENNTFTIPFPNIGQIMDIESKKTAYSLGQYGKMLGGNLISSNLATDLIDMVAVFQVLVPTMSEQLRVDSLFTLDPLKAKEFLSVFRKEVSPWYYNWIGFFKEDIVDNSADGNLEEEDSKTP